MFQKTFKIATRKSPLALLQANEVKKHLMKIHPKIQFKLLPMKTKGDTILNFELKKSGGKGLFVKKLQLAILKHHADLAIHSVKDIPTQFPKGLGLIAICKREDPRDAFISNHYNSINELPKGGIIGTSSIRRECQIRSYRPDLIVRALRGNINTRLNKLDKNEYDAIILAAAGLNRLHMKKRISQFLPTEILLPAVGQGAVGIECRLNDTNLIKLIKSVNHYSTSICVKAERAMNKELKGGCQVPIAAFATLKKKQFGFVE